MPTERPSQARRDWTRAELLKALSLYCQVPFGQIRAQNPHVRALAAEIGRTPASVTFKLGNLASFDPYHTARGVRGLTNASRADKAIWDEFYGRWDSIAEATPDSLLRAAAEGETAITEPEAAPARLGPKVPAITETVRPVNIRIGQAFFRNAVLSAWGGRCALTDISEPALLRASHIRPWSSDEGRAFRLDPTNGLCLNALHDAAFDRGLITFGEKFELCLSPRLRETVPKDVYSELFARREGTPLRSSDRFRPSVEAMDFHRERVFCQ